MQGQKHLVKCRCILPQFMKRESPPNHYFTVFSIIDEDLNVVPKYAQCNNCGIMHKVFDLCRSEIVMGRESMPSLVSIDELKQSLPETLVTILELNNADLPTWEMACFIVENKKWGDIVVLSSDSDGDLRQGKYVRVISEKLAKVESFVREEVVK